MSAIDSKGTGKRFPKTDANEKKISNVEIVVLASTLGILLLELVLDLIIILEYIHEKYSYWSFGTLWLMFLSSLVTNIFSLRWFIEDEQSNIFHWVSHCFFCGLFHRYASIIRKVIKMKTTREKGDESLQSEWYDLNVLHLYYAYLKSAPFIILQLCSTVTLHYSISLRVISILASTASLLWCTGLIVNRNLNSYKSVKWLSRLTKHSWYFSLLMARLSSIFLFAFVFGVWTMVPLGIHWGAMSIWILSLKSESSFKKEDYSYNLILGFIYCFSYFNIQEGKTRYRLMIYYSVVLAQNFASVLLFALVKPIEVLNKPWSVMALLFAVGGTVFGFVSMVLYYKLFHPNGPMRWQTGVQDEEKSTIVDTATSSDVQSQPPKNASTSKDEIASEAISDDHKFLLNHWMKRLGTSSISSLPDAGNTTLESNDIEIFSVDNSKLSNADVSGKNTTGTVTDLIESNETSFLELIDNNLNQRKRRAICSSDDLNESLNSGSKTQISEANRDENTDSSSSNKKTSSDSIDIDLDLSFSDVNSSDINIFNENIVQKLCLSTLKNIKDGNQDADIQNIQKIALDILKGMYSKKGKNGFDVLTEEIETEALSVHDYENICAVNIAREAWGLRSWNCYSDIQDYRHDGSVFRERKNETLTSTSSEISSCRSNDIHNHLPGKRSHTYSNVFIRNNPININNYDYDSYKVDSDVFSAKPYMIDNMLEPIIEEIDDFRVIDKPLKLRLNSESSLVATIDEIRKRSAANSPRNVNPHKEVLWGSPQIDSSILNLESRLKKALLKNPSNEDNNLNTSHIPTSHNLSHNVPKNKFKKKTDFNASIANKSITLSVNSLEDLHARSSIKPRDCKSMPELNVHPNRLSNSSRPRRKFSILREKFETKGATCDVNNEVVQII